ncbi:hypothetical protein K438DRAFT_1868078 [Mycena galopus ATCC 62051]|nr:hypothetical protein K438DRAFT_1868078 [Mycena galopus ATCC 62051]
MLRGGPQFIKMFNIYGLNAPVQLPHFGSYWICVELRFGFGTLGTALCYLTSFFNGCIIYPLALICCYPLIQVRSTFHLRRSSVPFPQTIHLCHGRELIKMNFPSARRQQGLLTVHLIASRQMISACLPPQFSSII